MKLEMLNKNLGSVIYRFKNRKVFFLVKT